MVGNKTKGMTALTGFAGICAIVKSRKIVHRAVFIAVIVGNVLALINHGDSFFLGTMERSDWLKVALTFLVPYTVSTVSSVLAKLEADHDMRGWAVLAGADKLW